jgi:uncharacterized membrane protein
VMRALRDVEANSTDAVRAWRSYASAWTAWNHVRTITSIGAAGVFMWTLAVR